MRSKEAIAVATTLALYRSTILPAARREIAGWRGVAAAAPDPELRAVALAALGEKAANPEATALFAALAPRRHRRRPRHLDRPSGGDRLPRQPRRATVSGLTRRGTAADGRSRRRWRRTWPARSSTAAIPTSSALVGACRRAAAKLARGRNGAAVCPARRGALRPGSEPHPCCGGGEASAPGSSRRGRAGPGRQRSRDLGSRPRRFRRLPLVGDGRGCLLLGRRPRTDRAGRRTNRHHRHRGGGQRRLLPLDRGADA